MRLSQAHLKLLAVCPRKFQHIYLDQFSPPLESDQLARMTEGSQFHLLLQQWDLGLPIASILAGDLRLKVWFEQFERRSQEILRLESEPVLWRQSEQVRTIEFGEHILTVVYDLVLLGQTTGKILDWKTYPKPRQVKWLQQDWQTKLYLYVLSETTGLAPEKLSMRYWFFQDDDAEVQSLSIGYGPAQHEAIRFNLQALCDRLDPWLVAYEKKGTDFPQVADWQVCQSCGFATRCGRSEPSGAAIEIVTLAEIEEIPL